MPFLKIKKKRAQPIISTSSLPDIIFMLLFFFMVVTVLRQEPLMLKVVLPNASESQKIQHQSLVNYLFIGTPLDKSRGTSPCLQVNDAFVYPSQVGLAIKKLVAKKPSALQAQMITAMKIDKDVKMDLVNQVKVELRKAQLYKVSYIAHENRE